MKQDNRQGFTLVEMMIAASLLVVTVSLAMAGFGYFLSETKKAGVQNKLDVDVQVAIEQIRYNLRLTSLEKMFFYPPGPGPYSAMAFPLASDIDGDGAIDVDASGNIVWTRTLVYHAWTGMPTQLRLTTFEPRNNALNDAQLQAQLNSVVLTGNGSAALGGTNATTKVIFENIFSWAVRPRSATYDGYASAISREENVNLGSIVLSNGNHNFTFTVIGTNPASSGYRIGIDSMTVSPSYSVREGEAQVATASAQVGASVAAEYMAAGSWSGNYQLAFPAVGVGNTFTLVMDNDRWVETNFRATGEEHANTTVRFNTAISPSDFVLTLDGLDWNWYASDQTGDLSPGNLGADALSGAAVRVLVRGSDMESGNWILFSGQRSWVGFRSGSAPLTILHAFIAETANSTDNTMDAKAGTMTRVRFSGNNGISLGAGNSIWSDQLQFPIDKTKSYLITYLVSSDPGQGNGYFWTERVTPGLASTFIIAGTNLPSVDTIQELSWSARGDVTASAGIASIQYLYATYPSNGLYNSTIFDTTLAAPGYSAMGWNPVLPSGTSVRLKVRTGNNADMSDATAWSAMSAMTVAGAISPGAKRFVQYQAELLPSSDFLRTPLIRDTTITWAGDERVVDVGGTFTKGPNYGIFGVKVDGKDLKQGVVVDLEIFDDVHTHGGELRLTSSLATEVTPRNTGR